MGWNNPRVRDERGYEFAEAFALGGKADWDPGDHDIRVSYPARRDIKNKIFTSMTIRVSVVPDAPTTSAMSRVVTCSGVAAADEMISTDTFGDSRKAGNLNSPFKLLLKSLDATVPMQNK